MAAGQVRRRQSFFARKTEVRYNAGGSSNVSLSDGRESGESGSGKAEKPADSPKEQMAFTENE